MKRFQIPFSFTIYDGDEQLCADVYTMSLGENDIKDVAKAMKEKNGGHPVELVDAATIVDKVVNAVLENVLVDKCPELECYDDVFVEVQEKMPAELIKAADEYIDMKHADVKYSAVVDGVEYSGTAPLGLTPEVFNTMVEAVSQDHHGLSDFDFLKEFAPEAYDTILDWTREWAFKECMTAHGVEVLANIKDFPVQVYEYEF